MKRAFLAPLLLAVPALAAAYGTYPIYGIHFYGTGAETQIKNGKSMYSLEMLYTANWDAANKVNEKAKLQDIKNKGFKVILRLDYTNQTTVPVKDDWNGRYAYAVKAGEIAAYMKDVVDLYVVGNEMTTHPNAGCRDALWYAKVFNAYDTNCVYDKIHANDPVATVMMGGLTGWPDQNNLIGGRNVDWLSTVQSNVDQSAGKPVIDGYAIHAYSGDEWFNDLSSPTEDPRFSDQAGLHSFIEYLKPIYAKHGAYIPVHITETNTYWMPEDKESDITYRANWMKEAYQAIDEWNRSADIKIDSLCWYTYSHFNDPSNRDIWGNAIMRTDNALLNTARADYSWVTANTNMTPGNPGGTLHFEAENYTNHGEWINDNGVQGTDWNDTDSANGGGLYRNGTHAQNRPDIGWNDTYTGFIVGWTAAGEWTNYQTLAGGRTYTPKYRAARGVTGNGSLRIEVDGVNKGTVTITPTANWNTYAVFTGPAFSMTAGFHNIKIVNVNGNVNTDWFELQ